MLITDGTDVVWADPDSVIEQNWLRNGSNLYPADISNKVGIGTSTPTQKLTVVGTALINGDLVVADGNDLITDRVISDGHGLTLFGSEIAGGIFVKDNGMVGINNINPAGLFQVTTCYSSISFVGTGLNDLSVGGIYTGIGAKTYTIQISSTGTPDQFAWNDGGSWNTGVAITGDWQLLNNGVYVKFAATTGHSFTNQFSWTAGAVSGGMIVTSEGNVGIGTTTPSTKLEVNGTLTINSGDLRIGSVDLSDYANGGDNGAQLVGYQNTTLSASVTTVEGALDAITVQLGEIPVDVVSGVSFGATQNIECVPQNYVGSVMLVISPESSASGTNAATAVFVMSRGKSGAGIVNTMSSVGFMNGATLVELEVAWPAGNNYPTLKFNNTTGTMVSGTDFVNSYKVIATLPR